MTTMFHSDSVDKSKRKIRYVLFNGDYHYLPCPGQTSRETFTPLFSFFLNRAQTNMSVVGIMVTRFDLILEKEAEI